VLLAVEVEDATTLLPALDPAPHLLLVNDDDLTFAGVRPDDASLQQLLASAGRLPHAVSRAVALQTAWDMLATNRIGGGDFVRAAVGVLARESADAVVEQFLALASTCMRRVLMDDARRRHACKRPQQPVEFVMAHHRVEQPGVEHALSVRRALSHLRARNTRQAVMVELRFFEGLSLDEIAAQLLVSPATVKRELRGGLEFLRRCLGGFRQL